MRMNVAVIGIGVMGGPIAANLASAGLAVVGHTRSPGKLGAVPFELVDSAEEAIARADVVLLTVPGMDDVDHVLGRTEAGIERAVRGKVVALLSTVDPSASQALGAALADAGAEYVEAPVAGSAVQAEEATLLVLASAARRDTVERLAPVLAAIGKRTIWCGPPPGAMTVKLANNLVQIGLWEAFAEGTRLIERAGVDLALFYDVLASGPMANRVLEAKTAKVLSGDLSAQAPLKHVHKDLGLVRRQSAHLDLDLPGVEADWRLFGRAVDAGLGDLDAMAILDVLRGDTRSVGHEGR
jgi:3-hydroxyisobutyrate dehydrogenase